MPSLLNSRKTQQQKIIETAQAAQVAGVASGGGNSGPRGENMLDQSPLAQARRRGPRSIEQQLAQTAGVDRGTQFLSNRTANFAGMGGRGGMGGGSMLRNKAAASQGMLGMSQQFAGPGSMLRKKSRAFANPSGI